MSLTPRQDRALTIALAVMVFLLLAIGSEWLGVHNGSVMAFRIAVVTLLALEGLRALRNRYRRRTH